MLSISKKDILKIAMTDPTVYACLCTHKYTQGVTWEEALQAMVHYLVEDKKALHAHLLSVLDRSTKLSNNP